MQDMLVKLYDLPELEPLISKLRTEGIAIRVAMAYDKRTTLDWIEKHFFAAWASECDAAFSNRPVSCILAIQNGILVGFACYDCTRPDYFGPTGVAESMRGRGVGKALCLAALHAMAAKGYVYAIIGAVGPADFYAKAAGATVIEGSNPGIYRDMLKPA